MRYMGMPFGMWLLFAGSFRKHLTVTGVHDAETKRAITRKAKPRYKELIRSLPDCDCVYKRKD